MTAGSMPTCLKSRVGKQEFMNLSNAPPVAYSLAENLILSYTAALWKKRDFKQRVKDYFIATRPWSFTLSLVSVMAAAPIQ